MGVEVHLYTPSDVLVTSSELRDQLRSAGMDVRFMLDQGQPVLEPAPEGALTAPLDVMAWPTASEKAALAADAIDRRDLNAVQSLYDEGALATCGYSVAAYTFDESLLNVDPDEDDDEEPEPIEPMVLEALRQARRKYTIRVRVRSSNRSYALMDVVAKAVGHLRGGLFVDPQTGEIHEAK
jgi:hypothetical protein